MCVLTAGNEFSWDVTGFLTSVADVEYNERQSSCTMDIGLTNPLIFNDNNFTASSKPSRAKSARLFFNADGFYEKGWIAAETDKEPYVQVTFLHIHVNHVTTPRHIFLPFQVNLTKERNGEYQACKKFKFDPL